MAMRLPFWAGIFTFTGVIILCTLGTWQLQRLSWKTNIIEKLDTAYSGDTAQPLDIETMTDGDFRYGRIEGLFLADKALLLGPRTRDKKIGNDLIVPLQLGESVVFINMGWTEWKLKDQPIYHLNNKWVWFEGLARKPGWNSFTPDNVPADNLWYKPDTAEMAAASGLGNPLPFMVYAEHGSHKFDAAFPNNDRWYPNNNHLQYAFFWFSMAGILLVIFGLRFMRPDAR